MMMFSSAGHLRLTVLLCLMCAVSTAEDVPVLVGEYGNFDRFAFRGNDAFNAETLRDALKKDIALIPFSRADRSFAGLCQAISDEMRTGYLSSGFPDVAVRVDWDEWEAQPVVEIVEGPRYRQGEVLVLGAEEEVETAIRDWLTKPQPPLNAISRLLPGATDGHDLVWENEQGQLVAENDPVWSPGRSCSFHPMAVEQVKPYIKRAIQDNGSLEPKFSVALVPQAETGQADLQIIVDSLGEVWTIDEIHVDGHERHTREEVIDYLGIEVGHLITPQQLRRWNQKLVQSGAFRWSNVYAAPKLIPVLPTELRVDVVESDETLKLTDQPDERQQLAFKFVDWMNRFDQQSTDLIIEVEQSAGEEGQERSVFSLIRKAWLGHSPLGGQLYAVEFDDPTLSGREICCLTFDQKSLQLSLSKRQIAFEYQFKNDVVFVWNFSLQGQPRENPRATGLRFGFGFGNAGLPGRVVVEPFPVLRDLGRFGGTIKREEDEFLLVSNEVTTRLDAATGRLIDSVMSGKAGNKAVRLKFHVFTAEGALEQTKEEILSTEMDKPTESLEVYDRFEEFIFAASQRTPQLHVNRIHELQILNHVGRAAFQNFSSNWEPQTDPEKRFVIPPPPSVNSSLFGMGYLLHAGGGELFAEDSVPHQFLRELAAATMLNDPAAGIYLLQIVNRPENGPILSWLFAELSAVIPFLPTDQLVDRALQRIENPVEEDLRQLISENGLFGRVFIEMGRAFRDVNDDEFNTFISGWPAAVQKQVVDSKQDNVQSDTDFSMLLLTSVWDHTGLRELVERRLYKLIDDPAGSRIRYTSGEQ